MSPFRSLQITWNRIDERAVATFVALSAITLLAIQLRKYSFYVEEDSYILARYVRNLAQGNGLVYNPGEREWGCTSTLLPILLAPLYALGISPITGARLLSVAAIAFASLRIVRMLARSTGLAFASLALLPLAAFAPGAVWSMAGLETTVFASLIVSALCSAIEERNEPARTFQRSVLWLLAATLTRPDAPLYAPCVWLAGWDGEWRGLGRRTLTWGAGFGLGLLALWGIHAAYYASWLPNPFYSKVVGIPNKREIGWGYVLQFIRAHSLYLYIAAGATLLALARRRAWARDAAVFALASLACVAYVVSVGGDWMPFFRFLVPIGFFLPPLLIWGAVSLGRITRVAGALGIVATAIWLEGSGDRWVTRLHVLRTNNDVFLQVGEAARGGDPTLTYAVADIGGFGWESEARILDLRGLTDHTIAQAPNTTWGPLAVQTIERVRPNVLIIKSNLNAFPELARLYHQAIVKLEREPLSELDLRNLLAKPISQGDADAAAYVLKEGSYQVVSIAVFPGMQQFWLIAARADAVPRLAPALRERRFYTGIAHYEAGDRALGLEMIQAELRESPYDSIGRLAQLHRLKAVGRMAEARSWQEEVVALEPANANAWNSLGFALALEKRFDSAVPPLEKALRLNPDFAMARNNLNWVRSEIAARKTAGK